MRCGSQTGSCFQILW